VTAPTPPAVEWITAADVIVGLGPSAAPDVDDEWLVMCTGAANSWAFRKRAEAGYVDDPTVVPMADAKLATVLYGVALFREKASTDSYPSFSELEGFSPVAPAGSLGQINRLLGVGKGQVDTPLTDLLDPVTMRRRRLARYR
jgi:hypothetical protein